MRPLVSATLAALAVTGLTQPTLAQMSSASPSAAPSAATQGGGAVQLLPANKKGAGGAAVLSQNGPDVVVTLQLPDGYTPGASAAIYSGSCTDKATAKTAGRAAYQLQKAANGSKTVLKNVTLDKLVASPYALVVSGTPPLCGDMQHMLAPQKP